MISDPVTESTAAWNYDGHGVHCISSAPADGAGVERPAILLVHGFGASTDHWRHNIPVLCTSHEVHAIDLLGFGRSAKPEGLNYGGELWRDQLVAYARERIRRPVVIVGNSLGGFAALAAGAALEDQAAGVVLLNAAGPFSDEQRQKKQGFWAKTRRSMVSGLFNNVVTQRLLFENLRRPATIRRTLNQVYIDKTNVDDQLVESILRPSKDPGAFGVFRTVFDIPKSKPLDELFAELKSPLLLLWGIHDPWINGVGRREIFRRYAPAATSEVVLEAGHCPHDEVPDQVNAALLDWLLALNNNQGSGNKPAHG